ncbi:metallophosphoesterase family protein [Aliirhizobium smilacinae]|uniref:Serine/threonine protein phosphatase n=1 Tax=Aliirhizobium smilacinae TaxID=1395944 RepID=A0A5C4XRY0_9HYPH|nr:metallophosphoesterase family protein [Rhizobium smilacinae]TNM65354.1 serine/threonine protein phosphatase [Rhizobium smilacinae]
MVNLLGWVKRHQESAVSNPPRRRIDLGSEQPSYPIYAIGDVHGCLNELGEAELRIARDTRRTERPGLVVLLGDYVDRGPSSAQVIEHLIKPSTIGLRRLALCGNHDDVFAKFVAAPEQYMEWLELGGRQTLASYGLDPHKLDFSRKGRDGLKQALAKAIPARHLTYLSNLPICLKVADMLFVHAGLRPKIPLDKQVDEDLMWIREPFLSMGWGGPGIVVHGHTPQPTPDVGMGRIGIDTGAFYSGKLTVLKIDGKDKAFI